jgi:hypothetical protein
MHTSISRRHNNKSKTVIFKQRDKWRYDKNPNLYPVKTKARKDHIRDTAGHKGSRLRNTKMSCSLKKTRIVYPSFQESKTACEACRSKCDYETFARCYNVDVESHQASNGALLTETFQKKIDNKNQKLNFSGVNAQWPNGLVEISNCILCAGSRSMLNHAISKWYKAITAEF